MSKRFESKAAKFKLGVLALEDRCVPASAVVTTEADSGPGSLREAILAINASTDPTNQITFSGFASAKTITLATALPGIAKPVTITGPLSGSTNLVTISGNNLVSLFDTRPAAKNAAIEFKNLILTKGFSNLEQIGGAITGDDEAITIDNCTLADNTAPSGGAVYILGDAPLAVRNSTISGNSATTSSSFRGGGGIFLYGGYASLSITATTVSGNTATRSGGAVNLFNGAELTLLDSTVSGNSSGFRSGGIYAFNATIQPKTFTLRNSTLAGNTSNGSGAALCVFYNSYGSVDILNCTISGNVSQFAGIDVPGGAISVQIGIETEVNITSSVVSGNTHTGGDMNNDLAIDDTATILNLTNSAIGTDKGFTVNGTNTANLPFGANLKLAALANNGGPTFTMAISDPASPLVNAGSNPTPTVANDQRGPGFARSSGGFPDIGAFELQAAPIAPIVSSFTVNDGDLQRSRLTKVVVDFVNPVNASLFQPAGQVKFTRTGIPTTGQGTVGTVVDATSGLLISPISGTTSSLTLTFANIVNDGLDSASLTDGRWQLNIVPAGNYLTPNAPTDKLLRRFFGDIDNNGTVDSSDFGFFPPFGTAANNPFDFNNNGDIDSGSDFASFGNRFGFTIT